MDGLHGIIVRDTHVPFGVIVVLRDIYEADTVAATILTLQHFLQRIAHGAVAIVQVLDVPSDLLFLLFLLLIGTLQCCQLLVHELLILVLEQGLEDVRAGHDPYGLPLCIHDRQPPDLVLQHDVCCLLHGGCDGNSDGWGGHVLGHARLQAAACLFLLDDVLSADNTNQAASIVDHWHACDLRQAGNDGFQCVPRRASEDTSVIGAHNFRHTTKLAVKVSVPQEVIVHGSSDALVPAGYSIAVSTVAVCGGCWGLFH
mmetsp:Transcript_7628/g.20313  ORF Transcript_7628/g.20313 Transcript_7628/m.20313 type:complete len:257 (-) Transcript_7628:438-1208(-)